MGARAVAVDLKTHHAAGAAQGGLGNGMVGVAGQEWIPDAAHLGMLLQKACDRQATGILALNAQRQRLDPCLLYTSE